MSDKDKDKFKFSSSYLNKPFIPNLKNDNNQIENEELIQENLEIENETPSKNRSKINNYDITYSISEQRPQTSGFNESNANNRVNNLTISTMSINSKKRKPFENLTFYSDKKNTIYNESNINENNNNNLNSNSNNISNINKEKEKENDIDSEMSEIQFKNINPLKESQTDLNISNITENEKSMIMSSYKLISKDTIEKAIYCSAGKRDIWHPNLDCGHLHLLADGTRHYGRSEVHCPCLHHSCSFHGCTLCDRLYCDTLHERQLRVACSTAHRRVGLQSYCSWRRLCGGYGNDGSSIRYCSRFVLKRERYG